MEKKYKQSILDEYIERICFQKFVEQTQKPIEYTFSSVDTYSVWDAGIQSGSSISSMAEIKVRPKYSSNFIINEGLFFLQKKTEALKALNDYLSEKKGKYIQPIYFIFTKDAVLIYKHPQNIEWNKEKHKKTNDPNCNEYVDKMVGYIPNDFLIEKVDIKLDYKQIETTAKELMKINERV